MIHTRIDMDDAWPVMEPFAPYFVNVLLDFLDDVNAPGAVAIRRPMGGRSFSSNLSDYFYSKMEQAPEHGFRFEHRDNRGQHHIWFQDKVTIRVKKLDRKPPFFQPENNSRHAMERTRDARGYGSCSQVGTGLPP